MIHYNKICSGSLNSEEHKKIGKFSSVKMYQIRHFETNKIQIMSMKQIDYLFYRLIALIDLCMDKVDGG